MRGTSVERSKREEEAKAGKVGHISFSLPATECMEAAIPRSYCTFFVSAPQEINRNDRADYRMF